MASKLSSRAECIFSSNESNIDWEGFGAKGDGGKLRWDAGRHSEGWLDGFFCDHSLFTSDCDSGAMQFKAPTSLCKREHPELDWLFKEMAFREFFLSNMTKAWLDLNSSGCHLLKDEHNVDIYSTLTGVTALFRDWCMVEKEFSETVMCTKDSDSEGQSKNQVNFSDSMFDSGKEAEFFTSLLIQSDDCKKNSFSSSLENVLKECYKNHLTQSGLASRYCASKYSQELSMIAYERDVHAHESSFGECPRSNLEESEIYEQFDWKPFDGKHKLTPASVIEGNISGAGDSGDDCAVLYEGMDMCHFYGKETPAASRFSFGRDSIVGQDGRKLPVTTEEIFLSSGVSEKCEVIESSRLKQISNLPAVGYTGQCHGRKVEQVNIQGEDLVPEGLSYALSYMNLHGLFTMERVCRSLRNRIKNDVLLWQHLHVELPMSNNLTDGVLLELASRSRGQLQCLSLADCTRVTEAALEEVVLSNPRLAKLCLPGCSRISADAVVRIVERHTSKSSRDSGITTLKQLCVRNMDGFTKEHLEKLQKMLAVKAEEQLSARKPQFYHRKHNSSFQDDDRAIDVEECPICNHVRLVYDCTRERCQQKKGGNTRDCRACILCITRCEACGRCITDNDYEETFSLDVLCSCCWLGLPKCAECNRPASGSHDDHVIRKSETTFVCCGTSSETGGSMLRICA